MLKSKVLKLEIKLSKRLHWTGVAFIDQELDIMKIPTLDFEGSIEEGYRKLESMAGDAVVIIDDILSD